MHGFNRSEHFETAVELLLRMSEIEALQDAWVVFDSELNPKTARVASEKYMPEAATGECCARVPGRSRSEAVAELTRALVYEIEEGEGIIENVPDSPYPGDYRDAVAAFRDLLFSPRAATMPRLTAIDGGRA